MWNIVSKFVNDFGSSTTEVGKYWITMFNVLRNNLRNVKWRQYACPSSISVRVVNPCRPPESTKKGLGRSTIFKAIDNFKRFNKTNVSIFNSWKCMGWRKLR